MYNGLARKQVSLPERDCCYLGGEDVKETFTWALIRSEQTRLLVHPHPGLDSAGPERGTPFLPVASWGAGLRGQHRRNAAEAYI